MGSALDLMKMAARAAQEVPQAAQQLPPTTSLPPMIPPQPQPSSLQQERTPLLGLPSMLANAPPLVPPGFEDTKRMMMDEVVRGRTPRERQLTPRELAMREDLALRREDMDASRGLRERSTDLAERKFDIATALPEEAPDDPLMGDATVSELDYQRSLEKRNSALKAVDDFGSRRESLEDALREAQSAEEPNPAFTKKLEEAVRDAAKAEKAAREQLGVLENESEKSFRAYQGLMKKVKSRGKRG